MTIAFLNQISYVYIFVFFLKINICLNNKDGEQIIISLTSDIKNIKNTNVIINSIFNQYKNYYSYKILLLLPFNEFGNNFEFKTGILKSDNLKKINILLCNETLTYQKRTIITMKKFKNNPILIVNNLCKLPDGWLDMFIKDHIKYPNDAIAASIQYFFGKNGEIKEFNDGFHGEKFGIFNHISEIIFNFAIVNIDLGGILYPKNFFQNESFYDYNLYLNSSNNSDEFWQSAFIIMENKILRQSSKIFDFTKYIIDDINYEEYNMNKKKLLEKSKLSFLKQFNSFNNFVNNRQKKIIVSIASYPERFV